MKTLFVYFFVIFAISASASNACNSCCQDGRDGRDGTDGNNGKAGKNGRNGIDGKDGKDGKNGINGRNGRDCKRAVRNWKQCAWNTKSGSGVTNGVIRVCTFRKFFAATYLKIAVASNMRIYNCDDCCKRWFVTINGKECKDPAPIDGAVYMRYGKGSRLKNLHRPRVIRGACKVPYTGTIKIGFNVGNCHGYGNADTSTGWNSSTNIYIEEMDAPQA